MRVNKIEGFLCSNFAMEFLIDGSLEIEMFSSKKINRKCTRKIMIFLQTKAKQPGRH